MNNNITLTQKQKKQHTDKEKALIVFHIPKTGGNSLQRLIERKFPPDVMYRFIGGTTRDFEKSMELLELLSEEEKCKIKCIWGGPFFGIHKYFHQLFVYIAFFRDPVERVISEYYWVLRRRTNYAHDFVVRNNISLEDYVKKGVWRAWNGQTRFIRRVPEVSPPGYGPVTLTDHDLNIAKQNLNENFIIGLTERFDESLILLKRMLAWRTIDILYVKQNVAKNRPPKDSIDSETTKLIEEHNELDIKLYEFAKQVFEEQLARQDPSFNRELRTFRLLNKIFGPLLNIYDKFHSRVGLPFISLVKLLRAWIRGEVSAKHVYKKVYDYFDYLKNVR